MISDAQFETMGLAIGEIATLKSVLAGEGAAAEESKGTAT